MGQAINMCGQNIFQRLVSEYGDQFVKLVVAEKSKDVVKEKFMELNNQSNNLLGQFEGEVNSVVDGKSELLKSIFQRAKSTVDAKVPGGIATIERFKGQSINEFSGYNKLQSTIDGVRNKALGQVKSKKEQVMSDLNGEKDQMINKIEKERPKVPIYEELPSELKTQILKKGSSKFAKQIDENKTVVLNTLSKNFVPDSYKTLGQFFQQVNPESSLSGIVGTAYNSFIGNMTGGGSFGGMVDKFL